MPFKSDRQRKYVFANAGKRNTPKMKTYLQKGITSPTAEYIHIRKEDPKKFEPKSFRTVDISHTEATEDYPKGTKAVVSKRKDSGEWDIQAVLVPKE